MPKKKNETPKLFYFCSSLALLSFLSGDLHQNIKNTSFSAFINIYINKRCNTSFNASVTIYFQNSGFTSKYILLQSEGSHQVWPELENSESALARSMRYANPWLYGSVRAPSALLLAPAFVLCSCPDYINGTKRSSKKSSGVCKKCKGSRLPLSSGEPKFGTVRCYPTVNPTAMTPIRAGTVRVTSSSSSSSASRPSILPSSDPYDLMRRSRLAPQDGNDYMNISLMTTILIDRACLFFR